MHEHEHEEQYTPTNHNNTCPIGEEVYVCFVDSVSITMLLCDGHLI
jgi:hypothetical protein